MGNYNFNKDLIIGEQGERTVAQDLESIGAKLITDNKNNSHDLIVEKDGTQLKYEIKTDIFCFPQFDTGNMFIEFECRGKKSGIEVTTADWFVMYYKYLKEIWYIKTDELKKLINDNQFFETEFSGDQNSNTRGYLIPREKYKKHFIVRKPK
jgi:hypothetical protein